MRQWASAECDIDQVNLPCVFSSRLEIQNQESLVCGTEERDVG